MISTLQPVKRLAFAAVVTLGTMLGMMSAAAPHVAEAAPAGYGIGCRFVPSYEAVGFFGHDYWSQYELVELCYQPEYGYYARSFHHGYYGDYFFYGRYDRDHFTHFEHGNFRHFEHGRFYHP